MIMIDFETTFIGWYIITVVKAL